MEADEDWLSQSSSQSSALVLRRSRTPARSSSERGRHSHDRRRRADLGRDCPTAYVVTLAGEIWIGSFQPPVRERRWFSKDLSASNRSMMRVAAGRGRATEAAALARAAPAQRDSLRMEETVWAGSGSDIAAVKQKPICLRMWRRAPRPGGRERPPRPLGGGNWEMDCWL